MEIPKMTITLPHFDTRTRESLEIKETIPYSMAEYLFPGAHFAIGKVYPEDMQSSDLREHNGMSLQFSSGKRMYFCDKQVRDLLYPNLSDGAVYGSLVFTPCKSRQEIKNARVLIVDHETGISSPDGQSDVIAREQAKLLVDDCWGQISQKRAHLTVGGG